jgi:hypothetical protein
LDWLTASWNSKLQLAQQKFFTSLLYHSFDSLSPTTLPI